MDAVGVAHEHVRPPARAPQRSLRHREVIADDVQLGDASLGEIDLARVGDRHLAAGDLDHDPLRLARRHGHEHKASPLTRTRAPM